MANNAEQFQTPLEYYEKAIAELTDTREQLQTELETLREMQSSYEMLKTELVTTKAELHQTQNELSETQHKLQRQSKAFTDELYSLQREISENQPQQNNRAFERFRKQVESQVNYCYSETQTVREKMNSVISNIPQDCLSLNYRKLEFFLENRMWKEADEETFQKLLDLAGVEKDKKLRDHDLNILFPEDLRIIDRLWKNYSNGQFGFSAQTQIYRSLRKTHKEDSQVWNDFGDQVGWRAKEKWLWYQYINFSTSAPAGHLPARIWDSWDKKGVGSFHLFLSRLIVCGI
ncbi:MAG: GUN4 domain-containing protein [Cyanobacteriota bacterium]|nr:GUN4 domain-containing protein [Cyanobacteriota bacterium]